MTRTVEYLKRKRRADICTKRRRDMINIPRRPPKTPIGRFRKMVALMSNAYVKREVIAYFLLCSEQSVYNAINFILKHSALEIYRKPNPGHLSDGARKIAAKYLDNACTITVDDFRAHMESHGYFFSKTTLLKLLHDNDFSYKFPSLMVNANTAALKERRVNDSHDLLQHYESADMVISLDETHTRYDQLARVKQWIKRGLQAPADNTNILNLKSVSVIVLTSNHGDLVYEVKPHTIKSSHINVFLAKHVKELVINHKQRVHQAEGRLRRGRSTSEEEAERDNNLKVLLLLDNARIHSPSFIDEDLHELVPDDVELVVGWLPPHTQDANPTQHVHHMFKYNLRKKLKENPVNTGDDEQFITTIHEALNDSQDVEKFIHIYEHTKRYIESLIECGGDTYRAKNRNRTSRKALRLEENNDEEDNESNSPVGNNNQD